MPDDRPPIEPNPPRWQPNPDPMNIHVPGLDTDASYLDQIEQIDQLITIKLQNIDANFSKMNSILANSILPAVKRFSVGTEPARAAATFWTSFYEMAAQVRIPTFDEYQSMNETTEEPSSANLDQTRGQDQSESSSFFPSHAEQSGTTSESSFMPANAQFASTPAATTRSRHHYTQDSDQTGDPSWNATMESPLVRLGREIQSLDVDPDFTHRPERGGETSYLPPSSDRKAKERMLENPPKSSTKPTEPRDMIRQKYQFESNQSMAFADPSRTYARTPQRPTFTRPTKPREDDSDSDDEGLPAGMSPPKFMSPVLPRRKTGALLQSPAKQAVARITSDLVAGQSKGRGLNFVEYGDYKYNSYQPASVASTTSSQLPSIPSSYRTHSHNITTDSSVISSAPSLSRHFPAPGREDEEDSMQSDGGSLESMMQRAGLYSAQQNPPAASSSSRNTSGFSQDYDDEQDDEHTIAPLRRRARSQLGQSASHRDEATDEDLLALMQQVTSGNNRNNSISSSPPRPPISAALEDPDSDSPDDEGYELGGGGPNMGFPFLPPAGGPVGGDDSFDSTDSMEDEEIPPGALGAVPFGAIVEDSLSSDEDDFGPARGGMGSREDTESVFGPLPGSRGNSGMNMGFGNATSGDEEDEETRRLNLHRDDFDTVQFEYRVEAYPQESPVNMR